MFFVTIFLIVSIAFLTSAELSSTNYQTSIVVSGGSQQTSSSNYSTQNTIGTITGKASSSSYIQFPFIIGNATQSQNSIIPTPTPTPVPSSGGSGGGSGGSGLVETPTNSNNSNFTLNTTFIPIEIKTGNQETIAIKIINTGATNLTVSSNTTGINRFIFAGQNPIYLQPGQTTTALFYVYAFTNTNPDVYLGQINFNAANITRTVNIALNIRKKEPLFDIITNVLSKIVHPGSKVSSDITVINKGDLEKIDVHILSEIRGFNNKTYSSGDNTYAVTGNITRKISLKVPPDLIPGEYVFYSKVNYGNITASSYGVFSVVKGINWTLIFEIAGIILGILIAAFFSAKGIISLRNGIRNKKQYGIWKI